MLVGVSFFIAVVGYFKLFSFRFNRTSFPLGVANVVDLLV